MNQINLEQALAGLSIGEIRYFDQIGSTNDEAAQWAAQGAQDLSLVLANEQTAGRGRQGRRWFTGPGDALAFSMVLRPGPYLLSSDTTFSPEILSRLTALGTLSVCTALRRICKMPAEIKWPNDVLLNRRKVAGVLVEASWQGAQLEATILGMGINVSPGAIPTDIELIYPATSIESETGKPVDRLVLLRAILEAMLMWREQLNTSAFLQRWEQWLAFRGERVIIRIADGVKIEGQILEHSSLDADGSLRLRMDNGELKSIQFGEVQ